MTGKEFINYSGTVKLIFSDFFNKQFSRFTLSFSCINKSEADNVRYSNCVDIAVVRLNLLSDGSMIHYPHKGKRRVSPPNRTISFVCFLQKSTKKLANYFLNGYTFTVIGKQAY
ncbi:hypothetical protein GYW75_08465 [Gilliamella sp. ESL0232]|uniref:hypothetical protein n=1 Tax=Gilliamella sp. ESL0232 TaxID=2705037 RepID=UPI0015810814|nr:hypothetical protein [Gilliamella sp. ESL0232]NUE96415.1 hypothetical protein [Gilliamella sp. ESL0232]